MFRELSWRVVNRRSRRDDRSDLISVLGLMLAACVGALAWASRGRSGNDKPKATSETSKETANRPPADKDKCPEDPCVRVPTSVLLIALLWLVLIVASFICYETIDGFADFVTFRLGQLPFEAIWFGAVGGWLISAQGIFEHNREWKRSYDYWHYVRPVLGAIIGTLGCLIFIVLNEAATKETPKPNPVFYDVIALAVGYREESFRKLLEKLFDSIILPGKNEKDDKTTAATTDGEAGATTTAESASPKA
jgi:hypothetical protein